MLTVIAVLVLIAMVLATARVIVAGLGPSLGMNGLRRLVRALFPAVPHWSGDSAVLQLNSDLSPPVLLVDLRSESEFQFSHLPGARRIAPEQLLEYVRRQGNPETTVLVYCAVGYRASKSVAQLQTAGFKNCFNLDGGIFEWANAGRPLLGTGGATSLVHPSHRLSEWLVRPEHRAPLPSITSASTDH